jgi:hypothetical protein
MKRRTLLKTGLTAVAALPLRAVGRRLPPNEGAIGFTDAQMTSLKAIAATVLPTEIGRAGTDDAAERFARWVKNYKPHADLDHGYGFTRIRATGPSPLPAYDARLKMLDARAGLPGGFAALPVTAQRVLIQQMLDGVERLPLRPDGVNLVADLMAFYFHSSQANDLCYRADIGREKCRGLPGSGRRPRRIT